MRCPAAWSVGLGGACLLSGCATTRPEDVPQAAPAAFTAAVDGRWPGASGILRGLQLDGERTLRSGDCVLYGLEIAQGERVTRHLLRIEVQRPRPNFVRGTLWFKPGEEGAQRQIPDRIIRPVELEFVLFDEQGKELQRSRSEQTPDWAFETSFLEGIRAANTGDVATETMASLRLLQIVNLLNADPILKRLLGEVASIPLDLRLLFRRELRIVPAFAAATPAAAAGDPFGGALGEGFDLPFDLTLNDSVFVRLSATVTEPRGPTATAAGIVLLRAQQASDPTRQIRLQLLAAARGPRSEWDEYGMLASCGAVDEGLGLAFAPDGRWVAMPGPRGTVELRDLAAVDPSVPLALRGDTGAVGDLAFLDATTLLVGRGASVEVFDLKALASPAAPAAELRPCAVVPTTRSVRALELGGARTCFVGLPAGEIQRWTFGAQMGQPDIEAVRAPIAVEARIGDAPAVPFYETPPLGFLAAGDDRDRVAVQWRDQVVVYLRRDGVWQAQPPQPFVKGSTRGQRWAQGLPENRAPMFDTLGKGGGFVANAPGTWRVYGGASILLLSVGNEKKPTRLLASGHDDEGAIVHGFDPSGRFYAFVAPGLRMLFDVTRPAPTPAAR